MLVFTEGEKTEVQYVQAWHRAHRSGVAVNISKRHGVPRSLVEYAIEAKIQDERSEKKREGTAYDEIWCVFDIDVHPNVAEAIKLAKAKSINLAISNPCVELWYLLHHRPQRAWLSIDDAQTGSARFTGGGKTLAPPAVDELLRQFSLARDRAVALEEMHIGNGSSPIENPSSSLWRLVDSIRGDSFRR